MRVLFFVAGALLVGCGAHDAVAVRAPRAGESDLAAIEQAERESFLELAAADARFARRAHLQPSQLELGRGLQLSLQREEQARLLGGAPDPLTRAPRERALERAEARLQRRSPGDPKADAEHALFAAIVREERLRFSRESQLPRDAARVIRAMAETPPPASDQERAENDLTLAVRLGEIEDSLDQADSLDGDAIADALGALDPQLSLYPETTKASTSLRLAVGQNLRAPTGGRPLPETVDKAGWVRLRARMQDELHAWTSPADTVNEDEREQRAAEWLFGKAGCPAAALPQRVSPSAERSFGCAAIAHGAEEARVLLVVIHDLLTFGLWAAELGEERADYRRVLARYAMDGHVPPELGARLARRAAAEPELGLRAGQLGAALASLPAAARNTWIRNYLAGGAFLPAELTPPRR